MKKYKKKGDYRKVKIAHKNLKGTSIEERPEDIETREEYGHWEMDCVLGKQGGSGAALLVLSERKSRQEIIIKILSKTQEFVGKAMDALEEEYGEEFCKKFKTITVDNGSEFLDFKGLERSTTSPRVQRVKIYYARPYSAWERDTNESLNKMIRRFVPKGTDIGKLSNDEIKRTERWLNNYPRRILGYKTPDEIAG
ncbi:MAG: transposase, family [Clostridiales bacterium]|nr:transposase, family [Clostridiales bacterium]